MLELGALTPALLDSRRRASVSASVGDDNGFVLDAQPDGWQAIFGEYTPNLRPTDLIPRQVQCLRSLLAASESDLRTIYLAPLDERCGTYLPTRRTRRSLTSRSPLALGQNVDVEREAVLVALDVGTNKVVALIGEVSRDGAVTVIGKGAGASSGLKKGVVINIDQTVNSITAGARGGRAAVGLPHRVGRSSASAAATSSRRTRAARSPSAGRGARSTREDIERATEVARAVNIPSNREVLHVLPRGFVVDGQEGVKDPLGMSAVRLEVETHIVHALGHRGAEPDQVRPARGHPHRRACRRARSRRPTRC